MSIILLATKAISMIIVALAAFMALAGALGADLTADQNRAECTASMPRACLFMIM